MKHAILTLPISPSEEPTIGSLLTPLVGDILANKTANPLVLCLNSLGVKLDSRADRGSATRTFVATATELGIRTDLVWRDEERLADIHSLLQALASTGRLEVEDRPLLACSCGKVEIPMESLDSPAPGKLYESRDDGTLVCRLCATELRKVHANALVFRPQRPPSYEVYPEFYSSEISAVLSRLRRNGIIISRLRSTELALRASGKLFNVDVDFGWQGFLVAVQGLGFGPGALVVSNHSLRQAAIALQILADLDHQAEALNIVVPPYLSMPGDERSGIHDLSARRLLTQYPGATLRLFLTASLSWKRKEVMFHSSQLPKYAQVTSARSPARQTPPVSLVEAISQLDPVDIRNAASALRRGASIDRTVLAGIVDLERSDVGFEPPWVVSLVEECSKLLGDNLYCVLKIGSQSRSDATELSDHDFIIILRHYSADDLKALRQLISKQKAAIDVPVFGADEVPTSLDEFQMGTHGAYFSRILREAKVLSGVNPFVEWNPPSATAMRLSAYRKVAEYAWSARRQYVEGNRSRTVADNYHLSRRVLKALRDLLLAEGMTPLRDAEVVATVVELLPNLFSASEVEMLVALRGRDQASDMSEEFLLGRVALLDKILAHIRERATMTTP